ncbi:MAG: hypothetical protein Q9P90_11765 [candidate division KSB1 bacterium]|nr:hypothetical protein [candidate division KSB1 bacterium]
MVTDFESTDGGEELFGFLSVFARPKFQENAKHNTSNQAEKVNAIVILSSFGPAKTHNLA